MQTRTLPGSTLAYGRQGWSDKVMALVWALFLILGSSLPMLYYFFSRIRSITTDYGVEISIGLACDVLPAFAQWVAGASAAKAAELINFRPD